MVYIIAYHSVAKFAYMHPIIILLDLSSHHPRKGSELGTRESTATQHTHPSSMDAQKQLSISRGPKGSLLFPRSSHIIGKERQEIGWLLLLASNNTASSYYSFAAARESRLWPDYFHPGVVVLESGNSGRGARRFHRERPYTACVQGELVYVAHGGGAGLVSRITCVKASYSGSNLSCRLLETDLWWSAPGMHVECTQFI